MAEINRYRSQYGSSSRDVNNRSRSEIDLPVHDMPGESRHMGERSGGMMGQMRGRLKDVSQNFGTRSREYYNRMRSRGGEFYGGARDWSRDNSTMLIATGIGVVVAGVALYWFNRSRREFNESDSSLAA